MNIKLGDLKVGERGQVTGFGPGDTAHRQKLLSMGLTPGAEFTVMRVAPLGDPVEVRVRGADLSLRGDEASDLLIERIAGEAKVDRKDTITIAIAGNPNCGKTTLFNGLTGTHQRVGNWGGVTVEKKVGEFEFADQRFRVVDMPGIHSLDTYDEATSIDERIARDYVLSGEADLIINIIDASHLEHSLYLTTQLLEMSAPVAVVLNIMDDVEGREARLDVDAVQRRIGCPVAAIVATRRKQIESLKADIQQWVQERKLSRFSIDYPPLIEKAISELSLLIRETSTTSGLDDRWLALRLLEGDGFATRLVTPAVNQAYARLASGILHEMGDEADTIIANSRYQVAHMIAGEALPKRALTGSSASDRIDRVVLNRFLGIPIFLGVMYCLFWFTIQLSQAFRPFFMMASDALFVEGPKHVLKSVGAVEWLTAVLADGLGNGLLQVVTFIPIIGFLYVFVSALEESGYMARANFVMDRLMKSLGLPGNAFIPMVVGFGCNVPAIMATRTMERPRDRNRGGADEPVHELRRAFGGVHGLRRRLFSGTRPIRDLRLLSSRHHLRDDHIPAHEIQFVAGRALAACADVAILSLAQARQRADQCLDTPEDVHLSGRQIHHPIGLSREDSERMGNRRFIQSRVHRAIDAGGGRTRHHSNSGSDGRQGR